MSELTWPTGTTLLAAAVLITASCTTATPTSPSPQPTVQTVELWPAYQQAQAAAWTEAADAELVSASAQWQGREATDPLARTVFWSFVFYSPTQRAAVDVTADAAGARVVNRTEIWTPPQPLAVGRWREGPQDALSIFLAYGGEEFLSQHPEAVVTLHLGADEDGKPVWDLGALDIGSRESLSVRIDAESLQVLSVLP